MGVAPFLVAYTTNIVMAQRLVRKICTSCKKGYFLDKVAGEELGRVFDVKKMSALFKANIPKDYKDEGSDVEKITFYKGEGCNRCGQTGYKGRMGIYEIMEMDEELIKMINTHGTADDIKKYAREKGMITMLEDGLIKAKMGITSISEVLRVTKE
jgi:type II secretory ATPase GspE/PulE/Tfp pilus assembly ATPase PilB-like protein